MHEKKELTTNVFLMPTTGIQTKKGYYNLFIFYNKLLKF